VPRGARAGARAAGADDGRRPRGGGGGGGRRRRRRRCHNRGSAPRSASVRCGARARRGGASRRSAHGTRESRCTQGCTSQRVLSVFSRFFSRSKNRFSYPCFGFSPKERFDSPLRGEPRTWVRKVKTRFRRTDSTTPKPPLVAPPSRSPTPRLRGRVHPSHILPTLPTLPTLPNACSHPSHPSHTRAPHSHAKRAANEPATCTAAAHVRSAASLS
jgi:hypothetical protein